MKFTRAIALGTGTGGFVSVLSALKDLVHQCLSLHPSRYGKDIKKTRLLAEALEVCIPRNDLGKRRSSRALIAEPYFGECTHFIQHAAKAKRACRSCLRQHLACSC